MFSRDSSTGWAARSMPARYFYELSIRHEDMHVEALAYTRQTLGYARPEGLGHPADPGPGAWTGDVDVPGGHWRLGSTPADGFVFDNEKWAHEVDLAPFRIAKAPVTNAEFAAFVEAGGYRNREFWSAAGWAWRERSRGRTAGLLAAKPTAAGWTWRRYREGRATGPACAGDVRQLVRGRSLVPLGQAPAADRGRMGGRRARRAGRGSAWPTIKRRWPWGEAAPEPRTRQPRFAFDGPLDVAACAAGDSAFGCRQMIGNVWEWTASDFVPFRASPPIHTKITRSRGSTPARCCAAEAGPPARGSRGRATATSSRPTATTSSPASAPARCRSWSRTAPSANGNIAMTAVAKAPRRRLYGRAGSDRQCRGQPIAVPGPAL